MGTIVSELFSGLILIKVYLNVLRPQRSRALASTTIITTLNVINAAIVSIAEIRWMWRTESSCVTGVLILTARHRVLSSL